MSSSKRRGLKVAIIGGGSYRILPILRAAFDHRGMFDGGQVRLCDLNVARAEAVGRMIRRTPEIAPTGCQVTWTGDADAALDGVDALYVTMAVGGPLTTALSRQASMKRGFISSDQLSLTGAMLACTAGPAILGFARKMERLCPRAMMLIFANPVAVYSGMVNNHTAIKALGVCGGFGNHRWDLTRIMGHDEYRDEYDVNVAGINHLSFILDGKFHGQDLYKVLGRYLVKGWKPPRLTTVSPVMARHINYALRKLEWMYHRFGRIIFSTEGDGMAHFFYEDMFAREMAGFRPAGRAELAAEARQAIARRKQADRDFASYVDRDLAAAFWAQPQRKNPRFAREEHDVAVPILSALAGLGTEKIAASAPARGAVAGFKDRTVLEFSQYVDARGPRAAGKYEIPDCFHGLISALATHQTLLGDAVATRDPRVLADAMFAYPVQQNTKNARDAVRDLLTVHAKEIPAEFQAAKEYC